MAARLHALGCSILLACGSSTGQGPDTGGGSDTADTDSGDDVSGDGPGSNSNSATSPETDDGTESGSDTSPETETGESSGPGGPDQDGDGVPDDVDNCLSIVNPVQGDADDDAVGDACDNCPLDANDQSDADGDGYGDACQVDSVRVAICQQQAVDADLAGNLARIESCVADAAADGAEIVLFPELADLGFGSIVSAPSGAELGEPIPGATSDAIGAMAIEHGVWIAVALLEVVPGGGYDTAVLIDSDGQVVLKQRKSFVYPVYGGARAFQGNLHDMQAVDTPWGPVAMMNCAETNFPARRAVIVAEEPALVLLTFANPQANLLDNAVQLAEDTGAPVAGTNMIFPGSSNPGGRSRFVGPDGAVLWQAGTSAVMQSWDLPLAQPRNRRPRADAGDVQTVSLPAADVDLEGYAADDERPANALETTWTVVSGPGSVSFVDAGAVRTTASFDTAGVYVLELTADDGERSHSSRTTVTVLPDDGSDPDFVAHWPFDGNANDVRSGNNGTLYGDPTYSGDAAPVPGGSSQSIDLDGNGDYVRVNDDASLDRPDGLTISLWVKPRSYPGFYPTGNDWAGLVAKGSTWGDENYSLGFGAYFYVFGRGEGMLVPSVDDAVRTPNAWYHVAMVIDPASRQAKIYIDGALDQSMHSAAMLGANGDPLYIGAFGPSVTKIDGRIDDVRLYGRPLSDAEIATLAGGSVNDPMGVDAGADQADAELTFALSGSAGDDDATPSADTIRWSAWRKLVGPGFVVFDDPYDPTTSATVSHPGRYLLELRASDGTRLVHDTVEIVVAPGA